MNKRGSSGLLIALIVFLVLVVLAGAVVFFFLLRSRSDMPDIGEFLSEIENSERTTNNNNSITDNIKIQINGGSSEFTFKLTNADLTALANDTVDSNDNLPLEDVLLNCNDDHTIDVTAVITDLNVFTDNQDVPAIAKTILKSLEDKRIYATVFIDYAGNNEFDIVIEDVRLEKLNIPFVELIFTPMTDNISQMLTDQLEAIGNFDLQDFSVEENYLEFSGTVSE